MKEFIKKNFAIILAFLLPIVLIAAVALSVYLPSLFISTDYNFVYALCGDNLGHYYYNCTNYLQQLYSVQEGKLVVNTIDPNLDANRNNVKDINENYTIRLFLHNTEKDESREIALEEAKTYTLSNLLTSPDGVTFSLGYDRGAEFFPFFDGGSSSGYYLTKGRNRSRLNLINVGGEYYYSGRNVRFLGWVLP